MPDPLPWRLGTRPAYRRPSDAQTLSDLLEVALLQKECGLMTGRWGSSGIGMALNIVPLFETIADLRNAASIMRAFAEPGRKGFCWLSCGAHPDIHTSSKVARTRPSASAEREA